MVYQSRCLYLNLSFNKDDDDLSKLERGRIYSRRNQSWKYYNSQSFKKSKLLKGISMANQSTCFPIGCGLEKQGNSGKS
jgi:hypothetical protein